MTEQKWLTVADPQAMLTFHRTTFSERKWRLFAVACCRRVWHLLHEIQQTRAYRSLIEALDCEERHADGTADRLKEVTLVRADESGCRYSESCLDAQEAVWWATSPLSMTVGISFGCCRAASPQPDESRAQSDILRDIFGNPFHPVTLDPHWLTPTVKAIVAAIYEERAFHRLPVLADALEDAGCTNADILNHCRSEGLHVRGCWPVDLILGKS